MYPLGKMASLSCGSLLVLALVLVWRVEAGCKFDTTNSKAIASHANYVKNLIGIRFHSVRMNPLEFSQELRRAVHDCDDNGYCPAKYIFFELPATITAASIAGLESFEQALQLYPFANEAVRFVGCSTALRCAVASLRHRCRFHQSLTHLPCSGCVYHDCDFDRRDACGRTVLNPRICRYPTYERHADGAGMVLACSDVVLPRYTHLINPPKTTRSTHSDEH